VLIVQRFILARLRRRAQRGRIVEVKRTRSAPASLAAPRWRSFIRSTGTGPIPVYIRRSGPCPCRTMRSRPSARRRPFISARNASASASIAGARSRLAPLLSYGCQRVVDRVRLTKGGNGAMARHGVSLLREVQAGFHLPRYAALFTQPSPSFQHSSPLDEVLPERVSARLRSELKQNEARWVESAGARSFDIPTRPEPRARQPWTPSQERAGSFLPSGREGTASLESIDQAACSQADQVIRFLFSPRIGPAPGREFFGSPCFCSQ
jgi:hypothetical protein